MNAAGLHTRTHTELTSLFQLEPEWRRLWDRCEATPFQSPEWVIGWIESFRPPELKVVEVRKDGELVGLAPLCCFENAPESRLVIAGAYTSDYLDWLIDPRLPGEIISAIVWELARHHPLGRDLDLADLPAKSSLLRASFPSCSSPEVEVSNVCQIISVPKDAVDARSIIPIRQKRNLRTARNRSREVGTLKLITATEPVIDMCLQALFQLHGERWTQKGQRGVLGDEGVQRFHRRVAPLLLKRGILTFYELSLNDLPVAALYGFSAHGTAYCYVQGFDPAYTRISPGALLIGEFIDRAVRSGHHTIDLLKGQEPYKYRWGVKDEETYRLRVKLPANSSNERQVRPAA